MEWINTDDKLPEECTAVLVYAPSMDQKVSMMYYDPWDPDAIHGEWVSEPSGPGRTGWSSLMLDDVTHWMPLPDGP